MTLNIALTPGEPAGIGPDIVIQMAQREYQHQLIAFADPDLLRQRAILLGLPLKLTDIRDNATGSSSGELAVWPVKLTRSCDPGRLDSANASYVISCLDEAINACLAKKCQAMVTGPIQKSVINDAGIPFSGHTEYLANQTDTDKVVMMLATPKLRVALATTHLPLSDVSKAISKHSLRSTLNILFNDLRAKFGLSEPRIIVAGLNPHAGEGGHLGREEIDTIEPVIREFSEMGRSILGPLPADTLFTEKYLSNADAVLAMYHDQGLPVLKYQGFGQAANITLGLPIVRTSVDHGTALDLAGSGNADISSLQTALDVAISMVRS